MTVDLAPFGRWTLRDKAAQRQSFFKLQKKGRQLPEEIGQLKICALGWSCT